MAANSSVNNAKWRDETALLDSLASATFPDGKGYITTPTFRLSDSGTVGVDLMDAKLDADAGGALLEPVVRRLLSGSLRVSALVDPEVLGVLDRTIALFASYLTGNAAVSTVGAVLYMHPEALASLSAVMSKTIGLPEFTDSPAGPRLEGYPEHWRLRTPNVAPQTVTLPGMASTPSVQAQAVYISMLGVAKLCGVLHETMSRLVFYEEDHLSTAAANGRLDLAWAVPVEQVLRGLVKVEARLWGLSDSGVDGLSGDSLFSAHSAAELLKTKATAEPSEAHTAIAARLRFIRHLLAGYTLMHPSMSKAPRKPFRWGRTYDLRGLHANLLAAHACLGAIKASHDPAAAEAAPGVDQQYERVLGAPHRARFAPLHSFESAMTTLAKHCADGTVVASLPALASYNPSRAVKALQHTARNAPGMLHASPQWPYSQIASQPGDDQVSRQATVSPASAAALGARLASKEPIDKAEASGITDMPLRWPDPLGSPVTCHTRRGAAPGVAPTLREDGSRATPAIGPHHVTAKIPKPSIPGFSPMTDAKAFDQGLVAQPRQHVSLRALWRAAEELATRQPDILVRAWAAQVTIGAPTDAEEKKAFQDFQTAGFAFDSSGRVHPVEKVDAHGRPVGGPFGQGVPDDDWQRRDMWRVGHVVSSTVFGTHTLWEVIAQDMTDSGVPADLLWSAEGRAYVTLTEGVLRSLLQGFLLFSGVRYRRRLPDEMPNLQVMLVDARYYDAMWRDHTTGYAKFYEYIAVRQGPGVGDIYDALATPLGGPETKGVCADAVPPATAADMPADLGTLKPFAGLPTSAMGLEERVAALASLPLECTAPGEYRTARWAQDARLWRTASMLYGDGLSPGDTPPISSLLYRWSVTYIARALRLHIQEGASQGLFHPQEALAVQWWSEAFCLTGVEATQELNKYAAVSSQWPELRALTRDALACALTGAVHSIAVGFDPYIVEAVASAYKFAEAIVIEDKERKDNKDTAGADGEEEMSIKPASKAGQGKGKGKDKAKPKGKEGGPKSAAEAYLTACRARDDALLEPFGMARRQAVSITWQQAGLLLRLPGPGRREFGMWAARSFLHRATARLLLVGSLTRLMDLLPVEPVGSPESEVLASVAAVNSDRWVPPGTVEAVSSGFTREIKSASPATFRHAGKGYSYRWREYGVFSAISPANPDEGTALPFCNQLYTYEGYCKRIADIMESSAGAVDPQEEKQFGSAAVPVLNHRTAVATQLQDASQQADKSQAIIKALSKEIGMVTALSSASGKEEVAKALHALVEPAPPEERAMLAVASGKPLPEQGAAKGAKGKKEAAELPSPMDVFASRLWTLQPGQQTHTAGELLWSACDAPVAARVLRSAVTAGVTAAKLARSPAFLKRIVESALPVGSNEAPAPGVQRLLELMLQGSGNAAQAARGQLASAALPKDQAGRITAEVSTQEPLHPSIKLPAGY